MDTIIYATDFSDSSKEALRYAYELSKRSGAQLLMLHVFDIPTIWNSETEGPTFEDITQDAREMKEQKLKDLFEAELNKETESEEVRFEARESASPVLGIMESIKDNHAGLIVMGTKGKNKAREFFIGSTTMSIVKQSSCPVLGVPEETNYQELNKILYATDFDPNDLDALKKLTEIADLYNTKILVEHIAETTEKAPEQKLQILKSKVEDAKIDERINFGLTIAQDIYAGLNEFVKQNDIDLLVMLEREHSGVNKWFHRDMVKRMEKHASTPILTYNENSLMNIVELNEADASQIG